MTYNFNEKTEEYYNGKNLPVVQMPKYRESKKKVIELLDSKKYALEESDFWILMNTSKTGKMLYSGLIISHNGCLKINDALKKEDQFRPECVTIDKQGYGNALVFIYNCPEQGIYEVGEVSPTNCKNEYKYAMALKRCMDRVVLKNCKLAYSGVYSDSEADEFKEPENNTSQVKEEVQKQADRKINNEEIKVMTKLCTEKSVATQTVFSQYGLTAWGDMTLSQYNHALQLFAKTGAKK